MPLAAGDTGYWWKLELQAVVDQPGWVQGIELQSLVNTASTSSAELPFQPPLFLGPAHPRFEPGSPYVVQAGLKFSTDHADLRLRSNLLSQPLKRWHERCMPLCLAAIAL